MPSAPEVDKRLQTPRFRKEYEDYQRMKFDDNGLRLSVTKAGEDGLEEYVEFAVVRDQTSDPSK